MENKTNELAVQENKSLGFMQDDTNVGGFEQMNMQSMAIPFLMVLQAQSPIIADQVEGYRAGDIINSITKENYGRSISFTCVKFEIVWIEWKPNRGGFVGYHDAIEAERLAFDKTYGKWKTKEGNSLQETYMYYIIIKGHESDGVLVYSADSADIKNAKKLNTMMLTRRLPNGMRAKPFHQLYKAEIVQMSNDKGKWYALDFKYLDFVDESMYVTAKEEMLLISDKTVDYAQLESDTSSTSNTSSNVYESEY